MVITIAPIAAYGCDVEHITAFLFRNFRERRVSPAILSLTRARTHKIGLFVLVF
jgi:hypothetical protein